jgi:hypothetical protein
MTPLHLPKRLVQVTRSFKGSDPGAWVAFGVAVLTLAAILAAFFSQ